MPPIKTDYRWLALRQGLCRQCQLSAFCLGSADLPRMRLIRHYYFTGHWYHSGEAREKAEEKMPCRYEATKGLCK